jgi:regulatory protein
LFNKARISDLSEISKMRLARGRRKTVDVFLNGKLVFSLGAESAAKEGLRVGEDVADSRIAELVKAESRRRCLDSAIRYLGYRPRSEAELRQRLAQRGFDAENIEVALAYLKQHGLVDDAAFAEFWRENRDSFSPRSRRLTRVELGRKGISKDIIDRTVETIDDEESAYRAAINRAHRMPRNYEQAFRRRLGEYLRRRGFSYGVAGKAVDRVWSELEGGSREEAGAPGK